MITNLLEYNIFFYKLIKYKNNIKIFIIIKYIKMGYFYIIHTREFINNNQLVYKIGRTDSKDGNSRFIDYPKDSIPLFLIFVNNSIEFESIIINLFKNKFIQHTNIGNEYFESNLEIMIDIIVNELKNNNYLYIMNNNDNIKKYNDKEIKKKIDTLVKKFNKFNKKNITEIFIPTLYYMNNKPYSIYDNVPGECADFINKINYFKYDNYNNNKQKLGTYLENDINQIIRKYFIDNKNDKIIKYIDNLIDFF